MEQRFAPYPQQPSDMREAPTGHEQEFRMLRTLVRALLTIRALPLHQEQEVVLRNAYLVEERVRKYPELQLLVQALARGHQRASADSPAGEQRHAQDEEPLIIELPIVVAGPLADALAHIQPDLYDCYTLQDAAAEAVDRLRRIGQVFQAAVCTTAETPAAYWGLARAVNVTQATPDAGDRYHTRELPNGWPPEHIEKAAHTLARHAALGRLQGLDGAETQR